MRLTTTPWIAAVTFALSLSSAGCGGDKKDAADGETAAPTACTTDDDCEGKLTCLGGECTDTSSRALYDDNPTNAVTPEKVKREVEQRSQQHVDRANEALDAE